MAKKDFGWTEVTETFKVLADLGVTPDDLKNLRANRSTAVLVVTILRMGRDGHVDGPLRSVSRDTLFQIAGAAACMTGSVYLLLQDHGPASLYTEPPDGFVHGEFNTFPAAGSCPLLAMATSYMRSDDKDAEQLLESFRVCGYDATEQKSFSGRTLYHIQPKPGKVI